MGGNLVKYKEMTCYKKGVVLSETHHVGTIPCEPEAAEPVPVDRLQAHLLTPAGERKGSRVWILVG